MLSHCPPPPGRRVALGLPLEEWGRFAEEWDVSLNETRPWKRACDEIQGQMVKDERKRVLRKQREVVGGDEEEEEEVEEEEEEDAGYKSYSNWATDCSVGRIPEFGGEGWCGGMMWTVGLGLSFTPWS